MKGIGVFVLVLLVGLGMATYFVTRPPDRRLDAQGRAWVDRYEAWRGKTERKLDRAHVGMTLDTPVRNERLIEQLRNCAVSFGRVGRPPTLLNPVQEAVYAACGEAEYAVQLNDEFGVSSLASTKRHLHEASDRLVLSGRNLSVQLGEPLPDLG